MKHRAVVSLFCFLQVSGILFAQHAVDPMNRYYRVVALVHLTGSGKNNDPVLAEYVAAGIAAANPAAAGSVASFPPSPLVPVASTNKKLPPVVQPQNPTNPDASTESQTQVPPSPTPAGVAAAVTITPARPGIISWSMELTDNKNMAIIQLVAADHNAFSAILADTRPEVKVFEVGVASKDAINKEMQKHRKDFNLDNFLAVAR